MRYVFLLALTVLYGCGTLTGYPDAEPYTDSIDESTYRYTVAPGDRLDIFVWRNPDISMRSVPVRPDGRISSPLVEDILASGKTPVQLARDIEEVLSQFIKEPFVTVTVTHFVGSFEQ
ncbi:MAG: polysaccharide biosynthesis/export family protein, partial [Proteobacteria bacterium]|nr:polysaccharide biosynthesis/export family protein [Pseudomonadota bacterium]